jgi:hypothetical protein
MITGARNFFGFADQPTTDGHYNPVESSHAYDCSLNKSPIRGGQHFREEGAGRRRYWAGHRLNTETSNPHRRARRMLRIETESSTKRTHIARASDDL